MEKRKAVFSVDVESCYEGGEQGLYTYLDIFRDTGIKGTFFVTGDIAENFPEIVEAILKDEHEVGSHGWRHPTIVDPPGERGKFLTELSTDDLEQHLGNSKDLLTRMGANPLGFRAIQFIANRSVFDIVGRHFQYDSSLTDKEDSDVLPDNLVELPLATFRGSNVKVGTPVFFSPVFPLPMSRLHLGSTSSPLVLYGHAFDFVTCNTTLHTSRFKRFWYYNRLGPERAVNLRAIIEGAQGSGIEFVTGAELMAN